MISQPRDCYWLSFLRWLIPWMGSVCVLLANPSIFMKTAVNFWCPIGTPFSFLCPRPGYLKGCVQEGEVVCNRSPWEGQVRWVERKQWRENRVWISRDHWRLHCQDHGMSLLPPQGSDPATAACLSLRLSGYSWERYENPGSQEPCPPCGSPAPREFQYFGACGSDGLLRAPCPPGISTW